MKQIKKIFFVSMLFLFSKSYSQRPTDIKTKLTATIDTLAGSVWFAKKNAKLTKVTKTTLDTIIKELQNNQILDVQIATFNQDFCGKCDMLSWKRANTVLKYFSKRGISSSRLSFTNRLTIGNLNRVDVFFVKFSAYRPVSPPLLLFERSDSTKK